MPLENRHVFAVWLCLGSFASAQDRIDFNRDIRPILSDNCFYCHGQDANKRQGDLRLDDRAAALEKGAFVSGDAAASALVKRILSDDPDMQMPPPKSNRRLSPEQKELLARWIKDGAQYSPHWAYVKPVRPELPAVAKGDWVRNSIDRFVLAKLEAEKLSPSPEADRATLIKRLSIDLVGLPPTPAEVDAFMADANPQAYENLVNKLLDSPHYGERQALPWLDAARYADSNGFQQDGDTWQWMWRDWVVRALNADLSFDQFTIWQLAGDLLPDATNDQKIASGFNRNHLLNGEGGAIPEEQRFVILFDRMDTTATTWMALTMACAQCHDHKYDPITMRDYYSLMDAFNRVPETGTPQSFSRRIRIAAPFLELPPFEKEDELKIAEMEQAVAAAEVIAKPVADAAFEGWREGLLSDGKNGEGRNLPEDVAALLRKPEAERTAEDQQAIDTGLRKHFDQKVYNTTLFPRIPAAKALDEKQRDLRSYRNDRIPRPMIMSDAQLRETAILDRGQYLVPTEKVAFNTPAFLPPLPADAPRNRLGFANWLVSAEHPLTARVQVNRLWQHYFGAGIVKTAEDFGVQSEYPLHGPLLDWLAVEFREQGWSQKHIHRLIVTSATYRQASKVSPELKARDLDNRLFARASRFRQPSLLLRDWALASAGMLNAKVGGQPVYPYQPDDVWESLAITKERDFTYPASSGEDLYRRSLYTFWRRTVIPANMFDASNRQACRVRSATTSTPLHALTTLNDKTWVEAARVLAEKSLASTADVDGRLKEAFRRVLCRPPTDRNMTALRKSYDRQLEIYQKDVEAAQALLAVGSAPRNEKLNPTEHAALTAVCLGLFNLDEALTRE